MHIYYVWSSLRRGMRSQSMGSDLETTSIGVLDYCSGREGGNPKRRLFCHVPKITKIMASLDKDSPSRQKEIFCIIMKVFCWWNCCGRTRIINLFWVRSGLTSWDHYSPPSVYSLLWWPMWSPMINLTNSHPHLIRWILCQMGRGRERNVTKVGE